MTVRLALVAFAGCAFPGVVAPATSAHAGPAPRLASPAPYRTENEQYLDAIEARLTRDIPGLATSDEARLDLEDAWIWRLDLYGKSQFHDPSGAELDALCSMNLRAMKAFAGVYEQTPDRAVVFDLQAWRRLSGRIYKPCEGREAGWVPYRDQVLARLKTRVRSPRDHWVDAAGSCTYVVLAGVLHGGTRDQVTVQGRDVVGTVQRVEGYTVESYPISGEVVRPKVVTHEVVKDGEDRLAVADTGGDPMTGARFGVDVTTLVGKCVGKTTQHGRKVLEVRALAVGATDRWEWTMWPPPPRRKVSGELENSTGTRTIP
jgi:hypothetical protein